jgi:capsid assembly protease
MNQPRELSHVRAFLNATPMAITEDGFQQMLAIVTAHVLGQSITLEPGSEVSPLRASLKAMFGDKMSEDESLPYVTVGTTAVLELIGTIVPRASVFRRVSSVADYRSYQDSFKAAERDDAIDTILTVFDSPGGVVNGCFETCDMVYKSGKRTIGLADTCAGSAAYAIFSQNKECFCTPYAVIGSIGVIGQINDASRAEKNSGVDIIILRSSELKAAGIGSPTASQMTDLQSQLDARADQFRSIVKRARPGVDFAAEDFGSVWFGTGTENRPSAIDLGLADSTATLDELLAGVTV